MSRFEPFAGVRYNTARVDMGDVVAPPYDVIDENERVALEARSPYNAVRVELARDDTEHDRHAAASCRLREWIDEGVLAADPVPAFYVYRMGWREDDGRLRQTTGVIGALAVVTLETGVVLAHERTMPKPLGDRLDLLRACRANLSPIWCLSPVNGLTALFEAQGPPLARCTDDNGVHHRLWSITSPAVVAAIAAAVSAEPLVIADGHHRYQTALAYRDERRKGHMDPGLLGPGSLEPGSLDAGADPGAERVMAFVVALEADELGVHPIHRLVPSLPAGIDVPAALAAQFEFTDAGDNDPTNVDKLLSRMAENASLALLIGNRAWLLRPRPNGGQAGGGRTGEGDSAGDRQPDSAYVEQALGALDNPELAYHHSPAHVAKAVADGVAAAGFLLRPATVDHIAAVARAHERMPEKTTFFAPKPRTGMVFRLLDLP